MLKHSTAVPHLDLIPFPREWRVLGALGSLTHLYFGLVSQGLRSPKPQLRWITSERSCLSAREHMPRG